MDSSHKRAGDEWIMPEVRWFPDCGTRAGLPQPNARNEMYQLWVVPPECSTVSRSGTRCEESRHVQVNGSNKGETR